MNSKSTARALALFVALAAAATTTLSHAATPVAVWDGDFNDLTKFTGYELTDWNETHGENKSSVTIDQATQGLMFDCDAASGYFTVLVKYSNLNPSENNKRVLFATTANSNYNYNRCGVRLLTSGKVLGLWNLANSASGDNDYGSESSGTVPTAGTLAFIYDKGSSGVSVYAAGVGDDLPTTALWNASGLKAGDMYGFAIGGACRNSNVSGAEAAQGMTISGIAVFNSVLTVNEMNSYLWPSEIETIAVGSDTTVSAVNALLAASSGKKVVLSVTSGVTIRVDTAFVASVPVEVASTGDITLTAGTQPAASYFSSVDFSGVQGAVFRSWLPTPGVVGVNFNKIQGNVVSGELVTSDSWVATTDANGNATTLFADGITKVTWSASNTYRYNDGDSESSSFLHGYLDDGANKGSGVEINIAGVPYETYDVVIYASTDTSDAKFQAKTVNGTAYTVDDSGSVSAGNAVWGQSRLESPIYGQNAMRIKNLSGSLTISGGLNTYSTDKGRGGIAAIQIMPPTAKDNIAEYTLTLNGEATNWSEGTWKVDETTVPAPTSGYVAINLTSSTTLTIDESVSLVQLTVNAAENAVLTLVNGENGSLVANYKVIVEGGVLQQGSASVLGASPILEVKDGATFDMNGFGINSSTKVYLAGAGAGNWPWALTSSSGVGGAILGGLYLDANATIGGAYELKVGQTQAGYNCYLQGHTLTKIGAGAFTGTNMNTPGTGTIDVQGGAMSVNQWNNLNNSGGDTTVILHTGTSLANGTDRIVPMGTLKLLGGTLTTARAFKVKTLFVGAGETANLAFGDGASASLTGDLTVTTALTLDGAMTFNKDEDAAEDVVVTAGALSSSGAISVGAGVTLNLGTGRPTGVITVAAGGALAAQLLNATEIITLSVSSQPSSVILYGTDGIEIANPRISYSDGTLTIKPPVPTLLASGTTDFDTAANWVNSTKPEAYGSVIIELSGDADIRLSGDYVFGDVTISGNGQVAFTSTSESTFDTDNIYLKNGARLLKTASPAVTATEINLDSGTVLKLSGTITEGATISGAGAVETYGRVDLASANTMTGGITVKSGSSLSASVPGAYGEYQASWSYAQQRQVVVEDGGTVDINNIANNDGAVALTIAGKGVVSDGVYAGAVKYSGANPITSGSRQISSIVLTGDAMVDLGAGWGLIHSGWGNARLGLNGHTLTVRGTSTFPIANVNTLSGAATTGTLVLEGATLELSSACNLAGVNIVANGCSTMNLAAAPSALGSLTIAPTASGTTASAWRLPSGLTPVLSLSNVSASGLSDGALLPLFTAPQDTTLSTDNFSVDDRTSTRFTTEISGNTIVATFHAGLPANFIHYDFNAANSIAADSTYNVGNLNPEFKHGKNGTAGWFKSGVTPYWGSNSGRVSPFHSGQMTVTSVIKPKEANNTILWNFGAASATGVALIAKDSSTVALVSWTGGADGSDVVAVTGIPYLLNKWHLITVVADANGTTLYVDDKKASVGTVLPSAIGAQGQLGSIHGSRKNYNSVGDYGFLLDDWRVYDTTLTEEEIEAMRAAFFPYATMFLLR